MLKQTAEDRWDMKKVLDYIHEKVFDESFNIFVSLLHYETNKQIDAD